MTTVDQAAPKIPKFKINQYATKTFIKPLKIVIDAIMYVLLVKEIKSTWIL